MTLNVVLRARRYATDRTGAPWTCAEIARRWLALSDESSSGVDLAKKLLARNGPLDLVGSESIDRIETNLQIAHAPKSAIRDFRTDYCSRCCRLQRANKLFEEAPLETRSIATAFCGRESQAQISGRGCSSPSISANSIRARS